MAWLRMLDGAGRFCRNDIDFAWKNHNFRASERETVTAHHVLPRALHVRRLQKRTVEFNATNARNSGNCMLIDTNSLLQNTLSHKDTSPRLGWIAFSS